MKDDKINHPFYLQVQLSIDKVENKADKYRNLYYACRIVLIAFGSAITVLSGLQGVEDIRIGVTNAILVLGALTTALTALDALLENESKKNVYKLMLTELREVRSEFVYYYVHKNSELIPRIESHLFPRYQSIVAQAKLLIEKANKEDKDYKQAAATTVPLVS